jgi:hypothetical protein
MLLRLPSGMGNRRLGIRGRQGAPERKVEDSGTKLSELRTGEEGRRDAAAAGFIQLLWANKA